MFSVSRLALLCLLISASYAKHFWGTQVLHVAKDKNIDALRTLIAEEGLDVWSGNQTTLDVQVPADKVEFVKEALTRLDIHYDVMIEDLQEVIDEENIPTPATRNAARQGHAMNWNNFQRLDVIYGYMDFLARTYPKLVSVHNFGQTALGTPLRYIKISSGRSNAKAVFIDGGIHAREWASPASVTYIIRELVENRASLPKELLELDFYVVPVLNPDGYEYTHTKDRMWRKNRSQNAGRCVGTDINRNFNLKFGGEGTSGDPCSEIYRGKSAASELETKALQNLLSSIRTNLKAYITFHSYGEYILIPYGHSLNSHANGFAEMKAVGDRAAAAIKRATGASYVVGNTAHTLYPAAGGSDDWTKGTLNVPYAYCIELRDKGDHGFILPTRLIIPTARDALEAIKVISAAAARA